MTAILNVLGAVLVLVAVRDVFETLLHPHGHGVVSETLTRGVWRGSRVLVRGNHHVLSLAGPVAFITVIAVWGALVVLGFALIIWPHLPEGFAISEGVTAADQESFVDALYISMVNLTSLGYGDIV